jgi:hypothetical protein
MSDDILSDIAVNEKSESSNRFGKVIYQEGDRFKKSSGQLTIRTDYVIVDSIYKKSLFFRHSILKIDFNFDKSSYDKKQIEQEKHISPSVNRKKKNNHFSYQRWWKDCHVEEVKD